MKLSELIQHRRPLFECRQSIEFVSGPGLGKSTAVAEAVRKLSEDYDAPVGIVTRILSGVESPDVKGFLMPLVDKATGSLSSRFSRPPVFPDKHNVVVYLKGAEVTAKDQLDEIGIPERGVLFLDEFGQADADVQKVAAELLLEQRINEYHLGPQWTVWAASNRVADRSGVTKRLAFVDNRMCSLNIDPDYLSFERWCITNGVHPMAITFAKRNPSIVFKDKVPEKGGKFCSARSLVLSTKMIDGLRPDTMTEDKLPYTGMAMEWLAGWLGAGDAAVYSEHIGLGSDLPSPDEVFADPDGCKLPDRIDARFVMAANLAMSLIQSRGVGSVKGSDKVAAALIYISKMQEELQVVFVQSVVSQAPTAMASPSFAEWATKNQKLILSAHAV